MIPLLKLICNRITWAFVTLALTAVFVFWVCQIMPGNVAQMLQGQFATEESIRNLTHQLGLDRPVWQQFLSWVVNVIQGDFGTSARLGVRIGPLLWEHAQMSLTFAALATVLVFIIGTSLGVVSAVYNGRFVDKMIVGISLIGISVPEFVSGSLLILLFGGVLPTSGYVKASIFSWEWLSHMILPVLTLTFLMLAHVVRTARISMIETLSESYIRTARLRGLPKSSILLKHALRNALLPTITVLGINVGFLIGGIVVVEIVFSYPGLGRLTLLAVQNRDIALIQACTLSMAGIYILASLLIDLLYLVLNPRLRVS